MLVAVAVAAAVVVAWVACDADAGTEVPALLLKSRARFTAAADGAADVAVADIVAFRLDVAAPLLCIIALTGAPCDGTSCRRG